MKNKTIILTLLVCYASTAFSQSEDKEKYSTKKIDVILKDDNGNNHFLVFSKIMSKDKSYLSYNIDFWVNNEVYINPSEVKKILFRAGEKNMSASYYKTNLTGSFSSGEAEILYFYMEESAIKELSAAKDVKIRMVMNDDDFRDFTISTNDNFKQALAEIMKMGNK